MPSPTVRVEHEGPVTVVVIDRPERRNAVDAATASCLYDAFVAFDEDPGAAVAVLAGAGDTFCAGADLKAVAVGQGNRVTTDGPGPLGPTRLELSKPVIAAIEGYAVAGGLELAIWCDLRVVGRGATLGVFCRRFGVPLVDGGTIRLPRLVGQGRALDLILTGRAVHAEEARAIGLVDRVVADGEARSAAVELATELSALPQACMRNDRRSVLAQWGLPADEALGVETRLGLDSLASDEARAGATRFSVGEGRGGAPVTPGG